jgi:peptidoglycan/LPS O-acetylase OafA/YrhL
MRITSSAGEFNRSIAFNEQHNSTFSVGLSWYDYYVTPTYRLGEFLVGILFGYAMHNMRNASKTSSVTLVISYVSWIVAIALLYNVFYNNEPFKLFGSNRHAYDATYRPFWSLAICYIVFACHQHQTGGFIRWFLSLNLWQPLSKMGLSIYIFHYIYLDWDDFEIGQKSSFGMWFSFLLHMSDIVMTTILGAILYLFVEAPTGRILALMWSWKARNSFKSFNVIKRESLVPMKSETNDSKLYELLLNQEES